MKKGFLVAKLSRNDKADLSLTTILALKSKERESNMSQLIILLVNMTTESHDGVPEGLIRQSNVEVAPDAPVMADGIRTEQDPLHQGADVMLGLPKARNFEGLTGLDRKAEQVRLLAFLAGNMAKDLAQLQRLLKEAVDQGIDMNPDIVQRLDRDLTGVGSESSAMRMEQQLYDMQGEVGSAIQELSQALTQGNSTSLPQQ